MVHEPAPRTLVAHALLLRGLATPAQLAEVTGLGGAEVEGALADLASDARAVERRGVASGWALTPAGRTAHRRHLDDELAASGARPEVEAAYERFLVLNPELLERCTRWQLRTTPSGPVANDHTDPAYDAEQVAALAALHERALPVLDALAGAMDRFGRYRPRLQAALDRVVAGDTDWFTRATVDSYHTVWFELHEDLLRTLGLTRGSEARSGDEVAARPEETETA